MATHTHQFDFLNQWASWPDGDVEKIVTAETIKTLQEAVDLLVDESRQHKPVVQQDNFVRVVGEMRKVYRTSSRALGEAILEASEYVDNNEVEKAKEVYERFRAVCESPFYRRIAEHQLSNLR